jgi:hypothetical protein
MGTGRKFKFKLKSRWKRPDSDHCLPVAVALPLSGRRVRTSADRVGATHGQAAPPSRQGARGLPSRGVEVPTPSRSQQAPSS